MFAAMGEVRRFAVAGLEEAARWAGRPGDRASDETGQQNKGEGSWPSTSARRCPPMASGGCPRSAPC